MDYIQTEESYRKLLKMCKEEDAKNNYMMELPKFLSLLAQIDVIMSDQDLEYFTNKHLLKNGKVIYEEAIKSLSIGIDLKKVTKKPRQSKRYLERLVLEDSLAKQSKEAERTNEYFGRQKVVQSQGQTNTETQKPDGENNTNLGKVQNDIQMLVTLFERDQIEKEMASVLKTTFLA